MTRDDIGRLAAAMATSGTTELVVESAGGRICLRRPAGGEAAPAAHPAAPHAKAAAECAQAPYFGFLQPMPRDETAVSPAGTVLALLRLDEVATAVRAPVAGIWRLEAAAGTLIGYGETVARRVEPAER